MSQKDVEVVEAFFRNVLNGDRTAGFELVHPGIVINEGNGLPWGGDHQGHKGLERLLDLVFGGYDLDVESRHFADAGSYVAVRLRCLFKSRATGESVRMPVVELYEVRDGLIWRGDIYYKDTKAIADLHAARSSAGPRIGSRSG